jgi:integrase
MTEQRISEKIVAELPAPPSGNKLHYFSGATLQGKKAPSGFAVRVTAAGTRSFVWFHRVDGRPHLETIGRWDENAGGGSLSVLQAILAATVRAKAVRDQKEDPRPDRTRRLEDADKPKGATIADLLDGFIDRYVEKEAKLRSAQAIRSAFDRLVKPVIGGLGIYDIRRSHVVEMLDDIADEHGPVMADRALAYLRKAFHWRAARDDDFRSPIVKGMARTKPKERARDRILADDEIRDLWTALDQLDRPGCYAPYIRFLLYTAARRDEAAKMQWSELRHDIWTVPAERYKNKQTHVVPLSKPAHDLIGDRPKGGAEQPFVFSTSGGKLPLSPQGDTKRALDKHIARIRKTAGREPMARWTLHDLRRTARSLMSRANVPADHAERAIGHAIAGVRAVYDHHKYLDEKRDAFEALAGQIARILRPTDNVINVGDRKSRRA